MKKILCGFGLLSAVFVSNVSGTEYFPTCSDYYVDFELLYWKAHVDGVAFAAQGWQTPDRGNVKELDWKWRPGFRLGVGTLLGCSEWDLSLIYTWYKGHAKGSVDDPTQSTLGTWFPGSGGISHADAKWNLRFNTIDLALAKSFCLCNGFVFKPLIALRGGYLREDYNIFYVAAGSNAIDDLRNKQNFWGIGPKGGLNTQWNFCDSWSLIGDLGLSLLWGHYNIRRIDNPDGSLLTPNNIEDRFATLRPVIEYRLGLGWNKCLCYKYPLNVQVLFEQQVWVNHNQMLFGPLNFDDFIQTRNTNLSLYGLTLKAQVGF